MRFLTFFLVFGLTSATINVQSNADPSICDFLSNVLPGYITSQPKVAEFLLNFNTACKNSFNTYLRIPRATTDVVNSCELINTVLAQLPEEIKNTDVVKTLIDFLQGTCDNLSVLEAFMKQFFEDQIKDVCTEFLGDEIKAIENQINALTNQLATLTGEKFVVVEENRKLKEEIEKLSEEIKNLKEENESLKADSCNDDLKACEEKSKELNIENSNLSSKIGILEKKVENLTEELEDFRNPVNGTCRFKYVSYYGYSCVGNKITINSAANQKLLWSGTHVDDHTNSAVSSLLIRYQNVQFLPLNVGKTFENLVHFSVESSGLKIIKKNDFKTLEKLYVLTLTGNEILTIESGSFDMLTQLSILNLRNNKIANLPTRAFEKLTALGYLDLGENKITQFRYDLISAENEIAYFYGDRNSVDKFDIIFVWRLSGANKIDFTGTGCGKVFDRDVEPSFKVFFTNFSANC